MKQGNRNKWLVPATIVGKHNILYYISHQSLLLRVSPQRLISVGEAENISDFQDADRGDGGQITFPNQEDDMEFKREITTGDSGEENKNNLDVPSKVPDENNI